MTQAQSENLSTLIASLRSRMPFSKERAQMAKLIYQLIASGQPLEASVLAEKTGQTIAEIEQMFQQLSVQGCELNEQGALVGATITQNPTEHILRVFGQTLYAWCALDTLFLPAYLDTVAEVESRCPISGEILYLTIGPQGVIDAKPAGITLSIVTDTCCTAGPDGTFCGRIHFFRSAEDAQTWAAQFDDVTVLSLDEAYQLAREVYIAPLFA